MLRVVSWLGSLSLILICLQSPAEAQTGLRGEVVNFENGAIIVGAKITVTFGSKTLQTASNDEGIYSLMLEPGKYDVHVEAVGFKKLKRKNVKIVGKGLFTFNVNMRWGRPVVVDSRHP